jgi:dolichol-phosphate mannosyltransferase
MLKVCVVLPCYNVKNQIYEVYNKLKNLKIDKLIFVDDCCPQKSVKYLNSKIKKKNKNVHFIFLKKNAGVGGATLRGFEEARKKKYDIVVKFDSDNQHYVNDLKKIINRLKKKNVYFCKGFRFFYEKNFKIGAPIIRIIGTIVLTYITRLITQNYQLKDVTNGLFGIKTCILDRLNVKKIKKNYFFEQDIIFYTLLNKIDIDQIKTKVFYGSEKSSLNILKIIIPFIFYHLKNITIKIFNK